MKTRRSATFVAAFAAVVGGAFVMAAATAASAGPSRDQAIDARLDHPHEVRPAAASLTIGSIDPTLLNQATAAAERRLAETVLVNALVENARREAAAAERAAARRRSASAPSSSWQGPDGVLACIRHRESRGNYGVVNSGSGASGAYQFMPGTWNSTARSAGRSDLVGLNPANASPADQDALAQHLLAMQGLRPWGGACG
ncbi:MAG: hypothetical protein FJW88_10655 [Actinobacteria bacterium]|nr:hypothetical protein [Actinomycetota bacterium]